MKKQLLQEITLLTSRSSGPGGQHVNKTESRVELHWNPEESLALSGEQKSLLFLRLRHRLSPSGELILACQQTRSQLKNREIVTERFLTLIDLMLLPPKKRVATRPSRSSVEKRLKSKKEQSEKKERRNNRDEY